MGADVWLTGPLPTPGIAFITSSMRADAGVVISASHNPYQDNGIKIFAADGFKLPDEVEAEIERSMEAIGGGSDSARAAPDAIGKAERIDDAVGRYVQFLKHAFPKELTLDGVKVVVDCANGVAWPRAAPPGAAGSAEAASSRPSGSRSASSAGADSRLARTCASSSSSTASVNFIPVEAKILMPLSW